MSENKLDAELKLEESHLAMAHNFMNERPTILTAQSFKPAGKKSAGLFFDQRGAAAGHNLGIAGASSGATRNIN